jgi:hypothetical protein
MKKNALIIGAVLTTLAVFFDAVPYGNLRERKAGDAQQQAIEETGKEEMAMGKEQREVLRKVEFESETPPTGVGGFFNVTSDNPACALRAATTSPDRSLVFYVAQ